MRVSVVRLAKQAEKYLTPGNPTGLTGLTTSPAPRAILINLYNRTLDRLAALPSSSAYRTSVEALTKHRLAVLAATKPEGHDAWLRRVRAAHPDAVAAAEKSGGLFAVDPVIAREVDDRTVSWDGASEEGNEEGQLVAGQTVRMPDESARLEEQSQEKLMELEPPLTAEQISDIEQKIGAGLIEEVIEVAKGELQLVGTMAEHKVWEEQEDKAPEGQWSYFERSARHSTADGHR